MNRRPICSTSEWVVGVALVSNVGFVGQVGGVGEQGQVRVQRIAQGQIQIAAGLAELVATGAEAQPAQGVGPVVAPLVGEAG